MNDREQHITTEIITEVKKQLREERETTKGDNKRNRGRPKKSNKDNSRQKSQQQSKSKTTRKSNKTIRITRDKQREEFEEKKGDECLTREEKCDTDDINESKKECNKVGGQTRRDRKRVRTEEEHKEAVRYLHKRINNTNDPDEIKKYNYMLDKLERTTIIV